MKSQYCPNCHFELESSSNFCRNCGQKNIKGRYSILEILKDFFGGLFNLDSKIWKTPIALFNPGFLTAEFFKGRRKRYSSPGRLLLFPIVIFFALVSILNTKSDVLDIGLGNNLSNLTNKEKIKLAYYLKDERDSILQHLSTHTDTTQLQEILDSLSTHLGWKDNDDTLKINNTAIRTTDIMLLDSEQIIRKYKIKGFFNQLIIRQTIKIKDNPQLLGQYIMSHLSWGILLSIPITGIILLFLYIRKNIRYTEHIVFLVHVISFAFIIGIPIILFTWITNMEKYNLSILFIWFLYLLLAMKNYYKQGWIKTFIKFSIFVLFYLFVAFMIMIALVVAGALLF